MTAALDEAALAWSQAKADLAAAEKAVETAHETLGVAYLKQAGLAIGDLVHGRHGAAPRFITEVHVADLGEAGLFATANGVHLKKDGTPGKQPHYLGPVHDLQKADPADT